MGSLDYWTAGEMPRSLSRHSLGFSKRVSPYVDTYPRKLQIPGLFSVGSMSPVGLTPFPAKKKAPSLGNPFFIPRGPVAITMFFRGPVAIAMFFQSLLRGKVHGKKAIATGDPEKIPSVVVSTIALSWCDSGFRPHPRKVTVPLVFTGGSLILIIPMCGGGSLA